MAMSAAWGRWAALVASVGCQTPALQPVAGIDNTCEVDRADALAGGWWAADPSAQGWGAQARGAAAAPIPCASDDVAVFGLQMDPSGCGFSDGYDCRQGQIGAFEGWPVAAEAIDAGQLYRVGFKAGLEGLDDLILICSREAVDRHFELHCTGDGGQDWLFIQSEEPG